LNWRFVVQNQQSKTSRLHQAPVAIDNSLKFPTPRLHSMLTNSTKVSPSRAISTDQPWKSKYFYLFLVENFLDALSNCQSDLPFEWKKVQLFPLCW
jgi:hypothetical protein